MSKLYVQSRRKSRIEHAITCEARLDFELGLSRAQVPCSLLAKRKIMVYIFRISFKVKEHCILGKKVSIKHAYNRNMQANVNYDSKN